MAELKNLNIKTILRDAKQLKLSEETSYHISYPEFIKYLKDKKTITKHELIIASHFVYSWMPTILKIDLSNVKEVLYILNKVKSIANYPIQLEELQVLKQCINNSLVGVSKLLHFIRPDDFTIWDSRILRYTTGQKSPYHIGNESLYLEYLSKIKKIAEHKNFKKVDQIITKQLKERKLFSKVSPLRVIELVMFETDKVKKKKK